MPEYAFASLSGAGGSPHRQLWTISSSAAHSRKEWARTMDYSRVGFLRMDIDVAVWFLPEKEEGQFCLLNISETVCLAVTSSLPS